MMTCTHILAIIRLPLTQNDTNDTFSRGKIFTLNFSVLGLFCQFLRPTAKVSGRFTANGCPH